MEEGREEKGRPRMGDDGRRCFCCDVTRRSKGGGASAVGGGRRSETDDVECWILNFGWRRGGRRKAGHGWGKMEEDVLLRRDTAQQRWGEERGAGEGKIASSRFAQSTQET